MLLFLIAPFGLSEAIRLPALALPYFRAARTCAGAQAAWGRGPRANGVVEGGKSQGRQAQRPLWLLMGRRAGGLGPPGAHSPLVCPPLTTLHLQPPKLTLGETSPQSRRRPKSWTRTGGGHASPGRDPGSSWGVRRS